MKKVVVLIVLVVGLISQELYAQDYTFRVLASKGVNKVKRAGAKWKLLKTGEKLAANDKLRLADNGYMGLVHANGKTVELKEAGTYSVAELSDKFEGNSKSIVSKYADFVISKMTPEVIEQNRKKYASVTGSGERGLYDSDIHLYLPKTVKLLNSIGVLTWQYEGENEVFSVSIKNILGELILTDVTSVPVYKLDFKNDKINEEALMGFIIVQVHLESDSLVVSQEVAISLIEDEEREELESSLSDLVSNLGKKSSLDKLILAEFYEQNGLILDAITSYENAVKLSPSIEYFQEIYDEFLIRNGLKIPESTKVKE